MEESMHRWLNKILLGTGLLVLLPVRSTMVSTVKDFIANHPKVVINFYRPGCSYCKYVHPIFNKARDEYNTVSFLSVNLDEADAAALKKEFNFKTVPTFIYYTQGKERARHGSDNKELVYRIVEENIQSMFS